MNIEEKETIEKIPEYGKNEKTKNARSLNRYFILGLICFVLVILDHQFGTFSYILRNNMNELVDGILCGMGLLFEFIGFYNNKHDITFKEKKEAFINTLFNRS